MGKNETDVIILCGLDGSGKTTQAKKLVGYLEEKNLKCEYLWIRYPNVLSLPFAALVRAMGMSVYPIGIDRKKAGIKSLENHNLLKKLWKRIFFFDLKLITFYKIKQKITKGKILVIDRFVIDSLVDLSIATGNESIIEEMLSQFLGIIPSKSKIFYISIEPKTSFERNHEENIETLQKRQKLYLKIVNKIDIITIDGNKSIEQIHTEILDKLGF